MAYLDKDAIQNSLTKENVIAILADLGSAQPKDFGENGLAFQTVCHGGSKYKLYYYEKATDKYPAKIFHCYTGCGATFNIYELVIRAKRTKGITITFGQAIKYVAHMTNNLIYFDEKEFKKKSENIIDDWNWINRLKRTKGTEPEQLEEVNEHILEMFFYAPHEEWLDDGISVSSIIKYEISYFGRDNKIIIPHRDPYGRLVGIRGRALNEWELDAGYKYMPLTIEGKSLAHKLGNNLYGLYQCREAIVRTGKLILVESEKSVLLGDTYFGDENCTVAVCGSSLSDIQCQMIKEMGVRELYFAYDKEYTDHQTAKAEKYYNKLIKLASKLTAYMDVYLIMDRQELLEEKDSPFDKGKKILDKLMQDRIKIEPEKEDDEDE